ncbi:MULTISPECIES: SgcJ/EcaC family oxidoreductase [unclassified Crossiella]|uniref:SgcJ/EcaC family oxidoreductase n=1 Tax=unclassified Crossiella TaxID=2620835 RepID=UPI001FFE51F0|nr:MULTISPECIES: SgcJ/EcaC family oxidoreductase [unclassified Crossiella]MCK2236303.1 SgcJ/EcaC family oxidoreductase [Crossiella sp. S99.2]MCK2249970.1 SgcJ/EcaC family oxidoreductase [Crossiella sp. S99.1]
MLNAQNGRIRVLAASALVIGLVLGGGAAASATGTDGAATLSTASVQDLPSKQEIAAQFTAWDAAIATGNSQTVANRYGHGAVLLPTLSNRVRTDRAGIVDYFNHFLENKPRGRILQSIITIQGPHSAVDTGTYRFTFANGSTTDARYTFVYEKRNGHWVIINHHSSKMPEG